MRSREFCRHQPLPRTLQLTAGSVDQAPASQIVGPAAANYSSAGVSKGVSSGDSSTAANSKETTSPPPKTLTQPTTIPKIFVAGSLAVDFACDYAPSASAKDTSPSTSTSNPAVINQSLGGVAHNVARAAHLMGGSVRLCSAVGSDLSGKAALEALSVEQMDLASVKELQGARTAQYVAINDVYKDLVLAMADMSLLDTSADAFQNFWLPQINEFRPSNIVLDANWQPHMLAKWLQAAKAISARVSFEPVSTVKGTRIFDLPTSSSLSAWPDPMINLVTPNTFELAALHSAARSQSLFDREDWWKVIDSLGIPSTGARTQLALATDPSLVDSGTPQQSIQLLPFIPQILTKLGPKGVLLTQIIPAGDSRLTDGAYTPYIMSRCTNGTEDTVGIGGLYMRLFPPVEKVREEQIASVNGVGDTFLGAIVAGLEKHGKDARVEDFVDIAQQAAVLTLKSKEAVSPGIQSLRSLL